MLSADLCKELWRNATISHACVKCNSRSVVLSRGCTHQWSTEFKRLKELLQKLEAIGKQNQEDLERFTCRISADVMVDPVVASNGSSYCRISMFDAMDYGIGTPGDDDGGGFRIIGMLLLSSRTKLCTYMRLKATEDVHRCTCIH